MINSETNTHRAQRLESLLAGLKAKGLRMTPQRLAILRVLVMNPDHPTVEAIHQALLPDFPSMSLATVYKTINRLKGLGEVLELEFSGRENRFDGHNPHPHPHLICTGCGRIMDPQIPGLDRIIRELSQGTGFSITSHRMDFFGLCADCLQR